MSEPLYNIVVLIHLSSGNIITYDGLWVEEETMLDLLDAHQEGKRFFATVDSKTIDETSRIIAIDFSSPHVVGMEIRVLNKEPAE